MSHKCKLFGYIIKEELWLYTDASLLTKGIMGNKYDPHMKCLSDENDYWIAFGLWGKSGHVQYAKITGSFYPEVLDYIRDNGWQPNCKVAFNNASKNTLILTMLDMVGIMEHLFRKYKYGECTFD